MAASNCSRTSSATHWRSSMSRTTLVPASGPAAEPAWLAPPGAGYKNGPSWSLAKSASTSSPTPLPVRAETGKYSSKPQEETVASCSSTCAGVMASSLFSTKKSRRASLWATKRSPPPAPARPSTTSSTKSASSARLRAVRFRCWPRAVFGLCKPGVSTKTAWASPRVKTALTAERVVCGLPETIETFVPAIALSKVDLPTLARPAMATTPQRDLGGTVSGTGSFPTCALAPGLARRSGPRVVGRLIGACPFLRPWGIGLAGLPPGASPAGTHFGQSRDQDLSDPSALDLLRHQVVRVVVGRLSLDGDVAQQAVKKAPHRVPVPLGQVEAGELIGLVYGKAGVYLQVATL